MMRAFCMGFLLFIGVTGCRAIEREGANPLPENGPALAYADMVNRARGQAGAAHDAFFIDAWLDVEQAAQRLEQTARLLPKTTNIPDGFKTKVEREADLLRKDAVNLLEAARAKNATQVNEALQRINQRVRQLRAP